MRVATLRAILSAMPFLKRVRKINLLGSWFLTEMHVILLAGAGLDCVMRRELYWEQKCSKINGPMSFEMTSKA